MLKKEENKYSKPRWNTAERKFYPHVKEIRGDLKNEMTAAEQILWQHLRNKKMGVKFRRQHIIDIYIPDFVALSIKLIIEVDGKIHMKKIMEDQERTIRLESFGYRVIRFKNAEIESNLEEVLAKIKLIVDDRKTNDLSLPLQRRGVNPRAKNE